MLAWNFSLDEELNESLQAQFIFVQFHFGRVFFLPTVSGMLCNRHFTIQFQTCQEQQISTPYETLRSPYAVASHFLHGLTWIVEVP